MALVLAFAVLLFFSRLGQRALWSEEMRWAEIPREMQLRANYLWPTINGRTYYDKPLGSYWLVLLAASLHGSVDEWAARCPAALSGVLAVVFLMLLARRLYDELTAVLAGFILASSFGLVFWSRQASTDAATVAGVLACLWLYFRNRENPGHTWTLLLWLFMALTSLTKGLLGFVLPMLIIGVYATLCPSEEGSASSMGNWARRFARRNRWFFNAISLLAIPLGLLVYLSPFLLSWVMTGSWEGLHMVYRENIQRFFHSVNHRGPVYLYLFVVFALLAPGRRCFQQPWYTCIRPCAKKPPGETATGSCWSFSGPRLCFLRFRLHAAVITCCRYSRPERCRSRACSRAKSLLCAAAWRCC